jgi:hypothetical protein
MCTFNIHPCQCLAWNIKHGSIGIQQHDSSSSHPFCSLGYYYQHDHIKFPIRKRKRPPFLNPKPSPPVSPSLPPPPTKKLTKNIVVLSCLCWCTRVSKQFLKSRGILFIMEVFKYAKK